ncbi:MAG: hypothetical protein AMXMBFR72_09290 [Betaproteobacteria bacterium]
MSRAYNSHSNAGDTAVEIAAAAARLIAEEGCDYALAKRKAVRAVLGEGEGARAQLPDNALIEAELRRYLQTFAADSQPAQLTALRSLALDWMSRLAEFNPHLVGAVLNGTATEHSDVHLHLFTDSVKDVEIALLNAGIAFEVEAGADEPGAPEEVLQFVVRTARDSGLPARVGVSLSVHASDAIRVAARFRSSDPTLHAVEAAGRANIEMLRTLLAQSAPPSEE